jgi:UDP-N-acetylglucosamine--N-acetylmuramyl-(pentapeptide) pyrophosphoryl-undecaprenol N-acetylglucosamine transferase
MNKDFKIIIAGGKTGGHLFPGISVAQALGRLNKETQILFVGTKAPFEIATLARYKYAHKSITSKPIKGKNIFSKAFSASLILVSLIQSLMIIKGFKPDFVLGVGGFSSFSVVLTAWALRIPTGIQEQNTVPGITNRLLSRFARIIFTSFKTTKSIRDRGNVKYVGNPVRKNHKDKSETGQLFGNSKKDKFTILITGGSQGASSINKAFMHALNIIQDKDKLRVIHQTGEAKAEQILKNYESLEVDSICSAFFHNMLDLQDEADLVICRAGAGTISELAVKGLPCILVPYPHAADDHQTHNAKALVDEGAAILIKDQDLTGEVLSQHIMDLLNDKEKRSQMSAALKTMAMPDADEKIAEKILMTKGIV